MLVEPRSVWAMGIHSLCSLTAVCKIPSVKLSRLPMPVVETLHFFVVLRTQSCSGLRARCSRKQLFLSSLSLMVKAVTHI